MLIKIREETFIHELIHVILNDGDYFKESDDEKLVSCLANGLTQVLKENNLLHD